MKKKKIPSIEINQKDAGNNIARPSCKDNICNTFEKWVNDPHYAYYPIVMVFIGIISLLFNNPLLAISAFLLAFISYWPLKAGWPITTSVLVSSFCFCILSIFYLGWLSGAFPRNIVVTLLTLSLFAVIYDSISNLDTESRKSEIIKIPFYCVALIGSVLAIQSVYPLITPKISEEIPQAVMFSATYSDTNAFNPTGYLFGNITLKIKPALLPLSQQVTIQILPSSTSGKLASAWIIDTLPYTAKGNLTTIDNSVNLPVFGDGWTYEQITTVIGFLETFNQSENNAYRLGIIAYPENSSLVQEQNMSILIIPISISNSAPIIVCELNQGLGGITLDENFVNQLSINSTYSGFLGDSPNKPNSFDSVKLNGFNTNYSFKKQELLQPISIKLSYQCVPPNSSIYLWLYILPNNFIGKPNMDRFGN